MDKWKSDSEVFSPKFCQCAISILLFLLPIPYLSLFSYKSIFSIIFIKYGLIFVIATFSACFFVSYIELIFKISFLVLALFW